MRSQRRDRLIVIKAGGGDYDIFWLHVPMKVARRMDMVESSDNLKKYRRYEPTGECSPFSSLDEVIKVAFHRLKDKVELLGVGMEKEIIQGNDVGVNRDRMQ